MEDFGKFRNWMKSSTRCYTDEKNGVMSVSPFDADTIFGVVKRSYLEWSGKDNLFKSDWIKILEAMLELKDEEQEDAIRMFQIRRAEFDSLDEPTPKDINNLEYEHSYLEDYIRCISKDVASIQEEATRWS